MSKKRSKRRYRIRHRIFQRQLAVALWHESINKNKQVHGPQQKGRSDSNHGLGVGYAKRGDAVQDGDGLEWLETYQMLGDEFVYCDPPYLTPQRSRKQAQDNRAFTLLDHERLLSVLVELPCMVAISGCWSDLYADRLAGWRMVTFSTQTRGGPVTEHLWMNYPAPRVLHDARYVGNDYRERERIKRKAQRWAANFRAMPPHERMAVWDALQECFDSLSAD